jgi:predicted acylesterase/phospholipase RssA
MPTVRFWGDEVPRDVAGEIDRRLPSIGKRAMASQQVGGRSVVNILALSGGGPDGAFGAGLLQGWTARGDRPRFEVVTGVSAGAIIAPFAFLGPEYDHCLEEIWTQYQTNQLIVQQILPAIFGGPALADTGPLQKLIEKYVDRKFLRAIAAEYARGRMLLVGTTNLDAQRPVVWNMGEIAASRHPDAIELFRKVILASAAIPGAFPPVIIPVEADGRLVEEMHVDGGVTREVFVAPVQLNLKVFDRYYAVPPQRRIYLVKNGKLAPEFEAVKPTAIAIGARSVSTLLKSQNYSDIYRIWRLARESDASFHLTAVPPEFKLKAKEAFDPVYQKALFQLGRQMGLEGGHWQSLPPELQRNSVVTASTR